jgi:hypothetical protein
LAATTTESEGNDASIKNAAFIFLNDCLQFQFSFRFGFQAMVGYFLKEPAEFAAQRPCGRNC